MNELVSNVLGIIAGVLLVGIMLFISVYFIIKVMNNVATHRPGAGILNRYKDLMSLCIGIYGLMTLLIVGIWINPLESVDPNGKYEIHFESFVLGSKCSLSLLMVLILFPMPLLGYSIEELAGRFRTLSGPRAELSDMRHVLLRYIHDSYVYKSDRYVRSLYIVKIGVLVWISLSAIMYFRLIGKMA